MSKKEKKPIYKKWWFWLLAVIIIGTWIGGEEETTSSDEPKEEVVEKETEEVSAEVEGKEEKKEEKKEKPKKEPKKELTLEERMEKETNADKVTFKDGILELTFNGDASWSENTIVGTHTYSAFESINEGFKDDKVNEVSIIIEATFMDNKGNESKNSALEFIYTRETFEELNYDNFLSLAVGEEWRILNESDVYFIHPGIFNNIKDEYKNNLPNGNSKVPLVED